MNSHHVIHYESRGDKDGNDVNMMVIKMMIVTPKCVRIAGWLGQNTNQSFGILSVGILSYHQTHIYSSLNSLLTINQIHSSINQFTNQ